MYTPTPPPPVPPRKPGSHDASRLGTPILQSSLHTPPQRLDGGDGSGREPEVDQSGLILAPPAPQHVPDPGEQWLPKFLEDKSKQDLAEILSDPKLLEALSHSPETIHPSLANSHRTLHAALRENIKLAEHLMELETRLSHQRAATQAQLLSTHALERQWRQKQVEMDHALAPFAPSSLYTRLTQALQEQDMICMAMEESFLEGDGEQATERETLEWVRRYREAKKLCYLRHERKERWNERRVGGWR